MREMHYFLILSDEDKERFEKRFAVPLLNNYGSTETLVGVVTDPPWARRWPSWDGLVRITSSRFVMSLEQKYRRDLW